ncbi:hypothetical protein C8R41DRAFT_919740 [Lentinula lateritia]|uniref:Uncharacterized protein n=1 Tax=Lentinula lateritia TaxID=40482 RepID=A0ABQ8VG92_9AGAR|nr:hypothetical protein C8R41DRAFT_919740 [Lentinula lateritia]
MGMVASGEDEEGVLLEVSMFRIPYLDASSWILFSRRPTNFGLSSSSVFLHCCTELTRANIENRDVLLVISFVVNLFVPGFDVPDTISGRYELDSALVQTSKPRPILQLRIPVLLH